MTTIATDGMTMAGDGFVTGNALIHAFSFCKVHKLEDGRIVGCTGTSYDIAPFANWLENGGDLPMLTDDFEALVLISPMKCLTYNSKCLSAPQEVPAVAGSGGAIALGAMLAGASPSQAVAIAAQRDLYSGGTIREERLND